nr:YjbH domain-containing protein [Arcobacter sp.]
MKKINKLLFLSLLSSLLFANSLAYNGSSGLIEIPNARIAKDFSGSIFYSNDKPYSHFGASFSVLPQVEVNAHISKIKGQNKDKVINLKVLLYPESQYLPSLVYGLEDLWGDLNYASKYIAISKKISYFDITLGYAVGRLGGSKNLNKYDGSSYKYLKNTSLKDGGVFAGIEFYASKNLRLLLEHSAIDYSSDKTELNKKAKTNVNFGLNYNINKNISTKLSLNRGNQVSFSLAYNFDLSKKEKHISFEDKKNYSSDMTKNLVNNDFSNIKMSENKDSLWLSAKNDSSYYDIESLLKAINSIVKSKDKNKYDYLYLDLEKQNKKVLKVNIKEFEYYTNKDLS